MKIDQIPFELKVILGEVNLSFEAYERLERGDILIFSNKLKESLSVEIGGHKKLTGFGVIKGQKRAIKLQ